MRLEPVTLGLPALHSASVLPGLSWKEGKTNNCILILILSWHLVNIYLEKKTSDKKLYTYKVSKKSDSSRWLHNNPGSTEAECRAGKPRVMGSNPVADKNFFLQKSFWWFILKKFKNVKMYFRKKEKEIQDFLWRS